MDCQFSAAQLRLELRRGIGPRRLRNATANGWTDMPMRTINGRHFGAYDSSAVRVRADGRPWRVRRLATGEVIASFRSRWRALALVAALEFAADAGELPADLTSWRRWRELTE